MLLSGRRYKPRSIPLGSAHLTVAPAFAVHAPYFVRGARYIPLFPPAVILIIAFFVFEPGGVVGLVRRLQRLRIGGREGREPMDKPDGEEPSPREEQSMEERVPTWAK